MCNSCRIQKLFSSQNLAAWCGCRVRHPTTTEIKSADSVRHPLIGIRDPRLLSVPVKGMHVSTHTHTYSAHEVQGHDQCHCPGHLAALDSRFYADALPYGHPFAAFDPRRAHPAARARKSQTLCELRRHAEAHGQAAVQASPLLLVICSL